MKVYCLTIFAFFISLLYCSKARLTCSKLRFGFRSISFVVCCFNVQSDCFPWLQISHYVFVGIGRCKMVHFCVEHFVITVCPAQQILINFVSAIRFYPRHTYLMCFCFIQAVRNMSWHRRNCKD